MPACRRTRQDQELQARLSYITRKKTKYTQAIHIVFLKNL
jgi:hypothetical protein